MKLKDLKPSPVGEAETAAQEAALAVAKRLRFDLGHSELGWPTVKLFLPCDADGESFGLSAFVESLALGVGIAPLGDLAATGVWAAGKLSPVAADTLPSKLRAAQKWGYRRVLVVKGQQGAAPKGIELLPVSREVSKAVLDLPRLIWPDLPDGRADERALMALARIQAPRSASTGRPGLIVGDRWAVRDFVGRKDELRKLRTLLRNGSPFIAIIGPAGFGKTHLLNRLLHQVEKSSRGGGPRPICVDCRNLNAPLERLFNDAGRILGRKDDFVQTFADPTASLDEKLAFFFSELSNAGAVWIVLDNLESLLRTDRTFADPKMQQFAELAMRKDHSIKILATSRDAPRFPQDHALQIVPLQKGLSEQEAVRYFRSFRAIRDLVRFPDDVLASLARKVHCVPLGLKSLVAFLSETGQDASALLQDTRLWHQYDMVNPMKGLISEQVRRQTPEARLVLGAVSVFLEPAPEAALQSMLVHLKDLRPILRPLVLNGLLWRVGDDYDMHGVIRDCVLAQLPSEGEFTRRRLHEKAGGFYLRLSEAIRSVHSDVVAPPRSWSMEPHLEWKRHTDSAGKHLWAAESSDGLIRTSEAFKEWCIAILREGRHQEIDDLCRRVVRVTGLIGCPELVAFWFHVWAVNNHEVGNYYMAEQCCERGLELVQTCSKPTILEGHLWDRRGRLAYALGDNKRAQEYFQRAEKAKLSHGDEAEAANSRSWIGMLLAEEGRFPEALDHLEACYALVSRIELCDVFTASVGWRLARVLRGNGDYTRAEQVIKKSLSVEERVGERGYVIRFLVELGLLSRIGKSQRPLPDIVRRVEDAFRFVNYSCDIPVLLCDTPHLPCEIGLLNQAAGCLDVAAWHYEQVLGLHVPGFSSRCLVRIGILRLQEGKVDEGNRLLAEGCTGLEQMVVANDRLYEPVYDLALARLARGLADSAVETYQLAVKKCAAKGVLAAALADIRLLDQAGVSSRKWEAARKILRDANGTTDQRDSEGL